MKLIELLKATYYVVDQENKRWHLDVQYDNGDVTFGWDAYTNQICIDYVKGGQHYYERIQPGQDYHLFHTTIDGYVEANFKWKQLR